MTSSNSDKTTHQQQIVVKNSLYNVSLMILIFLALGLRTYHLDFQSLWRDEIDAIRFSDEVGNILVSENSLAQLRNLLTRPEHNGPLYYVLLKIWRGLTGDSEFALRYFSALGGVLMVVLTAQVARRLGFTKLEALMTSAFIATSPYLIWYSQEAKMYTWLPCLILSGMISFKVALTTGRKVWWVVFVAATSLSFYVHILAPLMLAVYGLWSVIQWSDLKLQWRGWLIAMTFLTLPYVPLLIWQANLVKTIILEGYDSGHPFYSLTQQTQILLHLYSSGVLRSDYSFYAMITALFLTLLGLYLAPFWPKPAPRQPWLQVACWLIVPALLIYLISLRVPIFEDRYVIYLAPAYYILMASGVRVLLQRSRWLGGAILMTILLFNLWMMWGQTSVPIKTDFRSAANFVAEHTEGGSPHVIFQMPYLQHTFAYYFPEPHQVIEGIWTNDNRDETSVAKDMLDLTAGLNEVWFVVSEEDYWDQRRLTRLWLDEHGTIITQAYFRSVEVYLYSFVD